LISSAIYATIRDNDDYHMETAYDDHSRDNHNDTCRTNSRVKKKKGNNNKDTRSNMDYSMNMCQDNKNHTNPDTVQQNEHSKGHNKMADNNQ